MLDTEGKLLGYLKGLLVGKMKIYWKKQIKKNLYDLIRRLGYQWQGGQKDNLVSGIRRIGRSAYPRFHLFIKKLNNQEGFVLSLHLDQRRTIYSGSRAHSGEYDTPLVKQEAERIRSVLKTLEY